MIKRTMLPILFCAMVSATSGCRDSAHPSWNKNGNGNAESHSVTSAEPAKCASLAAGKWERILFTPHEKADRGRNTYDLQPLSANGWNDCYCRYSVSDNALTRFYFRILDNGDLVPLAYNLSWGWEGKDGKWCWEPDYDFFLDIDSDGVAELICPYCCLVDGVHGVDIFRLTEAGSEVCDKEGLLKSLFPDFYADEVDEDEGIGSASCQVYIKPNQPQNDNPLFVCWYQVLDSQAQEYPRVKDVKREVRLKGKRLAYRPYSSPIGLGEGLEQ